MKKLGILLTICLLLCGCGNKGKNEEINEKKSDIGSKDIKYKLDINCGERKVASTIFLGRNNEASYTLYECTNNELHLTTGSGSYEYSDNIVTITDQYEQQLILTVDGEIIKVSLNGNDLKLTKNN